MMPMVIISHAYDEHKRLESMNTYMSVGEGLVVSHKYFLTERLSVTSSNRVENLYY